MSDFKEKLAILLQGRRPHPWGEALGISKGGVESIKKGTLPGGEILTNICRIENANINYFLADKGTPFIVHKHEHADAFYASTCANADDAEDWLLHVLRPQNDENGLATLIWTLPAQLIYKGRTIEYVHTLVECGPLSEQHKQTLLSLGSDNNLELRVYQVTKTQQPDLVRIQQGQLGTFGTLNYLKSLMPAAAALVLCPPKPVRANDSAENSKAPERNNNTALNTWALKNAVKAMSHHNPKSLTDDQYAAAVTVAYKKLCASNKVDSKALNDALATATEIMQLEGDSYYF